MLRVVMKPGRATRRYRFGEVEVRPVADFPRKLCAGGVY